MNGNILVIQQNVPICPICASMMLTRHQDNRLFYFCNDKIEHIFEVVENGQAEIELLVTNKQLEEVDERL